MIVKHAEKQGPPPKQLMDAIAKFAEEETRAGTTLGSGSAEAKCRGRPRPEACRGAGDRDRRTFRGDQGGLSAAMRNLS